MMARSARSLALIFFCFAPTVADAASLRVSPASVSVIAPGSAATLTLRNEARRPLNVQLRVFRWTQSNGAERLEPTTDVVASPPASNLLPGENYTVRIVRTAKRPITEQESYRLVIDELPDPGRRKATAVNLVLRHSVPVFFRLTDAAPPQLTWSARSGNGALILTGRNTGGASIRLAAVSLLSQNGKVVAARKGLVGYVLPGASMQWTIPRVSHVTGGALILKASTETGGLDAKVSVQSR